MAGEDDGEDCLNGSVHERRENIVCLGQSVLQKIKEEVRVNALVDKLVAGKSVVEEELEGKKLRVIVEESRVDVIRVGEVTKVLAGGSRSAGSPGGHLRNLVVKVVHLDSKGIEIENVVIHLVDHRRRVGDAAEAGASTLFVAGRS